MISVSNRPLDNISLYVMQNLNRLGGLYRILEPLDLRTSINDNDLTGTYTAKRPHLVR